MATSGGAGTDFAHLGLEGKLQRKSTKKKITRDVTCISVLARRTPVVNDAVEDQDYHDEEHLLRNRDQGDAGRCKMKKLWRYLADVLC